MAISKTIKATIGEKSIIPIGGMIFLKIDKYGSTKLAKTRHNAFGDFLEPNS